MFNNSTQLPNKLEAIKHVLHDNPTDKNLNNIENKISQEIEQSNYEKNENWKFNLKINWIKLNIDLNPDKLVSALDKTNSLIKKYKENNLDPNENSFQEWAWMYSRQIEVSDTWLITNDEYMNIYEFKDIFWDYDNINTYINFLNQIIKK